MKPLMIPGLPLCTPAHSFLIVSPMGKAFEFPTWEELIAHVKKQLQSMKLEMLHYRFFVFTNELWLEVPMPVQWPLNVPFGRQNRPDISEPFDAAREVSSSPDKAVPLTPKKSK